MLGQVSDDRSPLNVPHHFRIAIPSSPYQRVQKSCEPQSNQVAYEILSTWSQLYWFLITRGQRCAFYNTKPTAISA